MTDDSRGDSDCTTNYIKWQLRKTIKVFYVREFVGGFLTKLDVIEVFEMIFL
jgi:hypothetical protein